MRWMLPLFCVSMGCQGQTDLDSALMETEVCAYPAKAKTKMVLDKVITPYFWHDARHMNGDTASLELEHMPCDTDDDIDWSPHDVLLFVSIPAW